MNSLLHYIKYRIKAKGRHGIHSPFVYSFINECLYAKVDKNFLSERKKIFKRLKNNHSTIEINDFGAGSKKLSNHRKISSIFKVSSSKNKYSLLLYRLVQHYKPNNILELGTSLGIGSIHLQAGNMESRVTTIEACTNTFQAAKNNFSISNYPSITILNTTFETFLSGYSGEKFDLVFIDGHHNGEALLHYLEKLKAITHNDTFFILDDIRWSSSMFEAWEILEKDPYYHVSIDLFRMGILLPRHQQVKENFTLSI